MKLSSEYLAVPNYVWFAVVLFCFFWISNAARIARGGDSLKGIVGILRSNLYGSYKARIEAGLKNLNKVFDDGHLKGPRYFSGGSYLACLGLATAYPALMILVSWSLLGGDGTFAGMQAMPADASQGVRLLMLSIVAGAIYLAVGWLPIVVSALRLISWPIRFAYRRMMGSLPDRYQTAPRYPIGSAAKSPDLSVVPSLQSAPAPSPPAGVPPSVDGQQEDHSHKGGIRPDRSLYEPPYDDVLLYDSDLPPERWRWREFFVFFLVLALLIWGLAYGFGFMVGAIFSPSEALLLPPPSEPSYFPIWAAITFVFVIALTVRLSDYSGYAGAVAFGSALALAATLPLIGSDRFPLMLIVFALFTFPAAFLVARWLMLSDRRPFGEARAAVVALMACVLALLLAPLMTMADQPEPANAQSVLSFTSSAAVLLLALLPAINAPFDWLSLGVTRLLLDLLTRLNEAEAGILGAWGIGSLAALAVIVVDGIVALLLSIGIVASTAAGTALFSNIHELLNGRDLYDVAALVRQMRDNPADPKHWWIYAMVFSTLIPTLVHFVIFAGTFSMAVLYRQVQQVLESRGHATYIADWIVAAHERGGLALILPAFVITTIEIVPGVGVLLLLIDNDWILASGGTLIATIDWLAEMAIQIATYIQN